MGAELFIRSRELANLLQTEAALRESQSRLSAALAVAQLGALEWDLADGRVRLDERSREIFGFAPDEGTRDEEIFGRIHPCDIERVFSDAQVARQSKTRVEIDYRIQLPDASVRNIVSKGDVFPADGGRGMRMLGGVWRHHLTRIAEEQLRKANDRLEGASSGGLVWERRITDAPYRSGEDLQDPYMDAHRVPSLG